jgi:ABC-2 type transport system ATP-binding protein
MTPALDIHWLTKRFGDNIAVKERDLSIPQGELRAPFGPSSAGKTTTLRIVAGLLRADSGTVSIMGHDVATGPLAAKRASALRIDHARAGDTRPTTIATEALRHEDAIV